MKVCILFASPRKNGNTASLLVPFVEELEKKSIETETINLFEKEILPCTSCGVCQDIPDNFGCPQTDDMQSIFETVLTADCIVLATPIYSWYSTPPMKALLDRLVYGMNKYYGTVPGKISLWEGKKCAVIATCGYEIEKGADLFEHGMKRYCKHSRLEYVGMLAERDRGDQLTFMDLEKIDEARMFASQVARILKS